MGSSLNQEFSYVCSPFRLEVVRWSQPAHGDARVESGSVPVRGGGPGGPTPDVPFRRDSPPAHDFIGSSPPTGPAPPGRPASAPQPVPANEPGVRPGGGRPGPRLEPGQP